MKFPNQVSMCGKVSTVIGSMFLLIPGGLDLYWGSISVYALSYIVSGLKSTTGVEVPATISLHIAFWCAAGIANGLISRYVNRRCVMLSGSLIINVAMCCSYYAIQNSLAMLNLTLGVFLGIGSGLLYGNAIHIVLQTANKDEGLLCSLILASYPLGGLIVSQLVTCYINPFNLAPDLKFGATDYFSQPDIINTVPSMFLVLGGFTLFMHTVGFLLLQVNPNMRFSDCSLGQTETLSLVKNEHKAKKSQETNVEKGGASQDTVQSDDVSNNCDDDDDDEKEARSKDFKPRDLLKTKTFYVFWLSFFMADYCYILLANYYKLYGQVWIHDDHFLTNLGTVSLFSTSLMRIVCGIALDKFDSKICVIIVLSSLTLTTSWYYFTAMVSGWLYFVATLTYANLSGATYCCYTTMVARFFGKTHVATNVGMLMSSCLAINLISPFIIDILLTNFGWFSIFAGAGCLSLINVLMCFIFIP